MPDTNARPGGLKPVSRSALGSLHPASYIFAAALLVRLIVLARLTASPFLLPSRGDMHFYNDWAQRILQGQLTDHLAFYGLPLYAYLLAGFYKIFGYGPFLPALFQALLEAGTATLLYQLARGVFGETARDELRPPRFPADRGVAIGVMAAAGWAFFVPAQVYSVVLMPTAWLVFVFWFVIWRLVKSEHAPGAVASLLYGLLIGVTAMGIATILFIVPLLLAAIIVRPTNSARPRVVQASSLPADQGASWKLALPSRGGDFSMPRIAAVTLLFAGIAVGTAPCWVHNYFVARDSVFLSAHSGVNFWIGNNPVANGYPRIPPGLRAGQAAMLQDSIAVAETAAGQPLKRSDVSRYWSDKAKAYIRENPGAWLKLTATKLRNFWNAFQYDDLSIITNFREEGITLPGPRFGLVAALALPGMAIAFFSAPASRWIIAAILLHMVSLLTVFVTERYRLAAVPGLLLFASFAIWRLWKLCTIRRYRTAAGVAAAMVAGAVFVSIPQRDPALWALDAYNSGWQALESGNLELAQKKLELAYAYVPHNSEINLALGNLHYERKDLAKADAYYRATLAIEPRHKSALTNRGVLCLENHLPDCAASLFRQALEIAPRDAKTRYLLARAELQQGNLAAADSEIALALEANPTQPEFLSLRDEIARARAAAGP